MPVSSRPFFALSFLAAASEAYFKSVAYVMKRLDGRMNESPYPLLPVPEALKIVLDHTKSLPTITVPLKEASGLILATDVHADAPLPPFPASMKDGYAVCYEVYPIIYNNHRKYLLYM